MGHRAPGQWHSSSDFASCTCRPATTTRTANSTRTPLRHTHTDEHTTHLLYAAHESAVLLIVVHGLMHYIVHPKDYCTHYLTHYIVQPKDPDGEFDTISWAAVEQMCYEDEEHLEIKVNRKGHCRGKVKFFWKTENQSIMPESYQDQTGAGEFKVRTIIPGH